MDFSTDDLRRNVSYAHFWSPNKIFNWYEEVSRTSDTSTVQISGHQDPACLHSFEIHGSPLLFGCMQTSQGPKVLGPRLLARSLQEPSQSLCSWSSPSLSRDGSADPTYHPSSLSTPSLTDCPTVADGNCASVTDERLEFWMQRAQSANDRYVCLFPGCENTFSRFAELQRHFLKHISLAFPCPVEDCQQVFTRKDKLLVHAREVHSEVPRSTFESVDISRSCPITTSPSRSEQRPLYDAIPLTSDYTIMPTVSELLADAIEHQYYPYYRGLLSSVPGAGRTTLDVQSGSRNSIAEPRSGRIKDWYPRYSSLSPVPEAGRTTLDIQSGGCNPIAWKSRSGAVDTNVEAGCIYSPSFNYSGYDNIVQPLPEYDEAAIIIPTRNMNSSMKMEGDRNQSETTSVSLWPAQYLTLLELGGKRPLPGNAHKILNS